MAKGSAKRGKSASKKKGSITSSVKAEKKIHTKTANGKSASNKRLPGSFKHTWHTFTLLKRFWRPLGSIVLILLVLNVLFAGTLGSVHSQVNDIKDRVNSSASSGGSKLSSAVDGFSGLVTGTNGSSNSSSFQTVLLILGSLVFIWALRQLLVGEKITLKQSFYQSMTPLIPFLLVAGLIVIQLLPLIIALVLLSVVLSGLVSSTPFLAICLSLLFALLAGWSLYMLSSSIFALYIVTLPDVEPLHAMRSAKGLVINRRWQIARKILFLPFFIVITLALVFIPLILFAIFLVTPMLFISSVLILLFTHAYLYGLYRRLLNE